ncbi:MAG TPA: response regulator [Chitinophagaceae bacterium]|nr:response regulator [Chitinophagaceae bacterium]
MKQQNIKRTFIVDDDPFWTAMLTEILSDLGYTNIITFENGTDCIKNLHLNPNLVFLDYQMEDMNGIEVLQKIKDYYPGIGVVFCTAHEDLGVAVNAMKYGSFDYLLKSNANKREVSAIISQMTHQQVFAEKIY